VNDGTLTATRERFAEAFEALAQFDFFRTGTGLYGTH